MDVAAPWKDVAGAQHSPANGDFDRNICLNFATDPTVTLCGHLYCSPCIRKWLMFQDENASPQRCPVCKASLSQEYSLVRLYRRGSIPK
ncbi:E3 ubiquitin-protein ligase RMA1H1 [Platanthera zijinensis]|uniref:E3 ubiquitin-protein ligase RMA n=1 Tax=Platanthera zijinensis TaxID=2320716 RepID=A0AAP0G378_9ASPA